MRDNFDRACPEANYEKPNFYSIWLKRQPSVRLIYPPIEVCLSWGEIYGDIISFDSNIFPMSMFLHRPNWHGIPSTLSSFLDGSILVCSEFFEDSLFVNYYRFSYGLESVPALQWTCIANSLQLFSISSFPMLSERDWNLANSSYYADYVTPISIFPITREASMNMVRYLYS